MERLIFPTTKKEAEKSGRKYSSEENKKGPFPLAVKRFAKGKGHITRDTCT